jgi:hypothetical protein
MNLWSCIINCDTKLAGSYIVSLTPVRQSTSLHFSRENFSRKLMLMSVYRYCKRRTIADNTDAARQIYIICWLLITVTGWYPTKRPMHCSHWSVVRPIWVLIIPDWSTRAPWQTRQGHLGVKQRKAGEKYSWISKAKYLCHTWQGSLTCRKILRHGADGFTSSPKEIVQRIFNAFKDSSSTVWFEPSNRGSNG